MNPNEITDIDARLSFRSMQETGNFSTYERAKDVLLFLGITLKFLKTFEGRTIGKMLKIIKESTNILGNYKEIRLTAFSLRQQVLELIAERYFNRRVIFQIEKEGCMHISLLDTRGVMKYIDPVEISFSQGSSKVQQFIADRLEIILRQEAKKDWGKIMKVPIGKGLIRQGTIKGWPIIKDYIYALYSILHPIYPSRAHVYGLKEWEGQKAKYPDALIEDMLQILKESFPENLQNLEKRDIISCIQYRIIDKPKYIRKANKSKKVNRGRSKKIKKFLPKE